MAEPDHEFARLVMAVVAARGPDNMSAIEADVFARLDAKDPADQERIRGQIELLIRPSGFREGDPPN